MSGEGSTFRRSMSVAAGKAGAEAGGKCSIGIGCGVSDDV